LRKKEIELDAIASSSRRLQQMKNEIEKQVRN